MAAPPSALPVEWEKLIAFAALPVMAGVLVLSFRRSGLRWIEHSSASRSSNVGTDSLGCSHQRSAS